MCLLLVVLLFLLLFLFFTILSPGSYPTLTLGEYHRRDQWEMPNIGLDFANIPPGLSVPELPLVTLAMAPVSTPTHSKGSQWCTLRGTTRIWQCLTLFSL